MTTTAPNDRLSDRVAEFLGVDHYRDHSLFETQAEFAQNGIDLIDDYIENNTGRTVAGSLWAVIQIPVGLGMLVDQTLVTGINFVNKIPDEGLAVACDELDEEVSTAIVDGVIGVWDAAIDFGYLANNPRTSRTELAFTAATLGGVFVGVVDGGLGLVKGKTGVSSTVANNSGLGARSLVLQGVGAGDVMLGGVVGAESAGTIVGTGALDASLAAVLNAPMRSVGEEGGVGALSEEIKSLCRRLTDEQAACLKRLLADDDFRFGQISSEKLAEIRRLFSEPSAELSPNQWTAEHWVRVATEDAMNSNRGMLETTLSEIDGTLQNSSTWRQASLPNLAKIRASESGMNNSVPQLMGRYGFQKPWSIAWRWRNREIFETRSPAYQEAAEAASRAVQDMFSRKTQPDPSVWTRRAAVEQGLEPIFQEILDDPGYQGLLDPEKPNPFDC